MSPQVLISVVGLSCAAFALLGVAAATRWVDWRGRVAAIACGLSLVGILGLVAEYAPALIEVEPYLVDRDPTFPE